MISSLCGVRSVPLVETYLHTSLFVGPALVGLVKEFSVPDMDFLLGNDLVGGRVTPTPVLYEYPEKSATLQLEETFPELFPVCAVTRSMASCRSSPEKVNTSVENRLGQTNGDDLNLGTLFSPGDELVSSSSTTGGGREGLIAAQGDDPELRQIRDSLEDEEDLLPVSGSTWKNNTVGRDAVMEKLNHLSQEQRGQLYDVLAEHKDVFRETPSCTTLLHHDIDVGETKTIKQSPYRVNPRRAESVKKKLECMLELGLIDAAKSEWSSPVTLVPRPDGSQRFCIDYREVNKLTRKDSYPLPRVEECIDQVGKSKFLTKIDMLKGYWQIPLTPRAREISCFTILGQTYVCNVMPYGLTNATATYQRLMNFLTSEIPGCIVYIDDVVIFSDTWEEHLQRLGCLLTKLSSANLVVNLTKCEFVQARVQYLGYVIG